MPENDLTRLLEVIEEETGVTADAKASLRGLATDSLEMVSLIRSVEEEFGVTIDSDDLDRLSSVGDLETFLGQRSARV